MPVTMSNQSGHYGFDPWPRRLRLGSRPHLRHRRRRLRGRRRHHFDAVRLASASTTRVGWTVGGGLEYALTNNWLIRAEYRYSQFGHSSFFADTAFPGVGASVDRKIDENQVQARLSYKFDTVAPAPVLVTK